MLDPNILLAGATGFITVIGAAYTTIKKWILHSKNQKEQYKQDIMKQVRSEANKIRVELEEKIEKVEVELETQKESIYKDLGFLKDSHNAEIRNLSGKIQELRDDLQTQHSQLVALLTRLVDPK